MLNNDPPIYMKPPCGILMYLAYASDFHRPSILICSSDTPFMAHVVTMPIINECEAYWASSIHKVCKYFFKTEVKWYLVRGDLSK